jgi:UDPglucose 6-dehydrogenase
METKSISVVGLGKLGAPLAACIASKGYSVTGVDVNPATIAKVNEGKAPVFEPGLSELMEENSARLEATDSYEYAIKKTQVTFITVPTPSDEGGGFSLQYVKEAIIGIGKALRDKDSYHLVVLTSTVLPGATDTEITPLIESISGKECGEDFGLCYSPEFIALGSVIRDFLNPDFVLIGESDPLSGDLLEKLYEDICDKKPQAARMNFINAELTKLAVNTYVTTKITFANMLARICEQLPGSNVDVVTAALGLDTRIGRKYLKGAVGYGGPCFPRDNVALSCLGRKIGVSAVLAEATDKANRQQIPFLVELIKSKMNENDRIGVLGLSYKPNTDVVEESQGLLLAEALTNEGINVLAYDPAAMENARKILKGSVNFAGSVEECVAGANLLIVMTPWDEFRGLAGNVLNHGSIRAVIDCWRLLDRELEIGEAEYVPLGIRNIP